MLRRTLAALSPAFVAALALVAYAQPEPKASIPESPDSIKNETVIKQEIQARQYKEFEQALLRMAQRLDKSSKLEDREKANTLRRAIQLVADQGVDNQFAKLVATLTASKNVNIQDIEKAIGQNDELVKVLRELLTILLTDDEARKNKEEQAILKEFLKEVNRLIKSEKIERAMVESGKGEKNTLAKNQAQVTEETKKLAKAMGKGQSEPKDDRSAQKGEGKPGEKSGEHKPDTKEAKGSPKDEAKKPAENKEGKPSESKSSSGSENKEGKPSESKSGDPKSGDPKSGSPKSGSESKPMSGDPKSGEQKPNEPKPNETAPPKEEKPAAEPKGKVIEKEKPAEAKPTDPKDGEKKSGEQKSSQNSQGKNSAESKSKSDGKGDAKSSPSKGEAKPSDSKSGNPSQSPPSDSQGQPKEGSQQGQPKPPSQGQQPQQAQQTPGRKQVQDAIDNMKKAEEELKKDAREKGSDEQTKAIDNLEKARQELEKRLKQLRDEEQERLLANLKARCERMLAMQIEVYENTKRVEAAVLANDDHKPTRNEVQKAIALSDREQEIVIEADKAITLLKAEGSAVAFPAVFEEVQKDMISVKEKLYNTRVGRDTQGIEEDIIASLKEMIAALEKARQDLKDQKNQPSQSQSGPQNQKLIDLLAELKLIRSLQVQVNSRTKKMHAGYEKEEQADDAELQKDLRLLAERQRKIEEMTRNIATGKNQ